jgi:hypothetical protein
LCFLVIEKNWRTRVDFAHKSTTTTIVKNSAKHLFTKSIGRWGIAVTNLPSNPGHNYNEKKLKVSCYLSSP